MAIQTPSLPAPGQSLRDHVLVVNEPGSERLRENVGICNGAAWKPSSALPPLPSKNENSSKMSHFTEMLMAECHYRGKKEASRSDLEHLGDAETTFLEWITCGLRWLFTGIFLR